MDTLFLTTVAAAERLEVSPRTVARMVETGRLTPVMRAGHGIRAAHLFKPEDIEALLQEIEETRS